MRLPLALLLCIGCTGTEAVQGIPFSYPLDGRLRLNHLQAKGTHNSYHVETSAGKIPEWHYTHPPIFDQLYQHGVRQIELDVTLDVDVGYFEVYHVPLADEGTRCRRFTDCLAEVRRFSDRYPGHHPIYIQIEPKDGFAPANAEGFFGRLEEEIRSVFPEDRIITPALVQGDAPNLRAALGKGWPLLSAVRGKVFFALDTGGDIRRYYTHGLNDLRGRLLFVDSGPADPFAGVAVLNDPRSDAAAVGAAVAAGLLVRTRADADSVEPLQGDGTRLMAALSSGAHFISTDYLTPAASGYVMEVPGGTPSRCNPLNAPAECTSLALENPAFTHEP